MLDTSSVARQRVRLAGHSGDDASTAQGRVARLRGVLDGHDLARVFAWLRPNDLVSNCWVNNYLIGNNPPAFDILYWNRRHNTAPARLHGDYIDLYFTNPFVNPGKLTLNGVVVEHEQGSEPGRQLRRKRRHGPHHAVESSLQVRAHLGRQHDIRAVE